MKKKILILAIGIILFATPVFAKIGVFVSDTEMQGFIYANESIKEINQKLVLLETSGFIVNTAGDGLSESFTYIEKDFKNG